MLVGLLRTFMAFPSLHSQLGAVIFQTGFVEKRLAFTKPVLFWMQAGWPSRDQQHQFATMPSTWRFVSVPSAAVEPSVTHFVCQT